MKKYYSYIRVSTARQGEGVSLIAQKEANERYAEKYNMRICEQMDELETAAKQGRPVFNRMVKLLKQGKADGVIIHKIDRSARNLKDWAELGGLIDQGIEVHFSHESVDMQTRGGRLSANLQAVIAEDYIRNLRQEAIKGLYGRLKQGIYPFGAPIGYLDMGKAKPKSIDPIKGPLIRKAFELYATRKYSFHSLPVVLKKLGLTTNTGKPIQRSDLTRVLNNPFYMGIIKVKGQIFNGKHEPIITPALFKQVQCVLRQKDNQKTIKHEFIFRRLIKCKTCGHSLIAETRKGHVYYRCHSKSCPTTALRESRLDITFRTYFKHVQLLPEESLVLDELLNDLKSTWDSKQEELLRTVKLQMDSIEKRLERLTDCYVDEGLDKVLFERRKEKLLIEMKEKEATQKNLQAKNSSLLKKTQKFLGLSKSLMQTYEIGNPEEKLELIKTVTSDLVADGKKLAISMVSPFFELQNHDNVLSGAPSRDSSRKIPLIFDTLNIITPCERKPLSREQLKILFDIIIESISELPEDNDKMYGV